MVDKLDDVWAARDFPVLVEVTRRIDAGEHAVHTHEVAEALGVDEETVQLAGAALERRGLVETRGSAQVPVMLFRGVTEQAYFLTGLHPDGDDVVSRFVDALRQAADRTTDPDERSRLRKLADGVGGVSREVFAAVVASVVTSVTGAAG